MDIGLEREPFICKFEIKNYLFLPIVKDIFNVCICYLCVYLFQSYDYLCICYIDNPDTDKPPHGDTLPGLEQRLHMPVYPGE